MARIIEKSEVREFEPVTIRFEKPAEVAILWALLDYAFADNAEAVKSSEGWNMREIEVSDADYRLFEIVTDELERLGLVK